MAWARAVATAANAAAATTRRRRWRDRVAATHRAADVCAVAATVGDVSGMTTAPLQAAARAAAAGGALGEEGKDDRGHYAVHTTAHAAHGSE